MASAEPKKRKFKYPGMIMSETDSSSNDSTMHSDHNNLPPQKKPKFSHPDRLMEDSSLSDNSLSDQESKLLEKNHHQDRHLLLQVLQINPMNQINQIHLLQVHQELNSLPLPMMLIGLKKKPKCLKMMTLF